MRRVIARLKTRLLAGVIMASCVAMAAVPTPWSSPVPKDGVVSVCGREYAFASNALPTNVRILGSDILSKPMRIVCRDEDGYDVVWLKGGSWVQEKCDEAVTMCAWQEGEKVTADATARVEFDGMVRMTLALVPTPRRGKIRQAWLEIPFRKSCATLFSKFPARMGTVENSGTITGVRAWPFCASMWIGNEDGGLCWFCESDEDFRPADAERVLEIVHEEDAMVLRVHLVDTETELPATWTFGLQATPVKPWNAKWNENHIVHAPRMGVGMTIGRPKVWWTAQRAFPEGKVEETIAEAARQGVKTIVFHEDWIPVQNNPAPFDDFKAIVDLCHAHGIKVLVYLGYELSPLDPLWGRHHKTSLATNAEGRPAGDVWYREPGQRDYRVCYASAFASDWLARAEKAYDELGIDGYFLDSTIMAKACCNERHGCGWTDAAGQRHGTYPFFAVREMVRRLYEFVKGRGGVISAHQSGYMCPATLAFADAYWDGEQLAGQDIDVKRRLDVDAFRAEFMGRNYGVPCEFLVYEVPGLWSYDDALALTLIHDVLPRPASFANVKHLEPIWRVMDSFGTSEADWVPYWEKPVPDLPAKVEASVYRRGGKSLIVVSNVSPDKPASALVKLPNGASHACDELAGRELTVADGKVRLDIQPFRMVLIKAW